MCMRPSVCARVSFSDRKRGKTDHTISMKFHVSLDIREVLSMPVSGSGLESARRAADLGNSNKIAIPVQLIAIPKGKKTY